jgi:hypothetical protein
MVSTSRAGVGSARQRSIEPAGATINQSNMRYERPCE